MVSHRSEWEIYKKNTIHLELKQVETSSKLISQSISSKKTASELCEFQFGWNEDNRWIYVHWPATKNMTK